MTGSVASEKEIYDYGIRHIGSTNIIAMSFQRPRMERLVNNWNARDGYKYELVERVRYLIVTEWEPSA